MSPTDNMNSRIGGWQRNALICAVIGIVGMAAIFFINRSDSTQFFRSYLFAFVFWMSFPLGAMSVLMLHHLTGGRWGLPIRRILEASSRTVPLTAILGLPIIFGMSKLYIWTNASVVRGDEVLLDKRWWLNTPGFIVRYVIYFALWMLIAGLLTKWSREQDATGNPALADRMVRLSAPGVVIWGFVLTGASVDWVMSLEPHWYSTIYGLLFIVISALAAFSFTLFMLCQLSEYAPVRDSVAPKDYNDLGNILLAFLMLWAYLSFSQLLIIWAGNLKEEIPWYQQRAFGGWQPIGVALVVFHFFVPWMLLLQRGVKRRLRTLSFVALWIVILTLLDIYWIVEPSWDRNAPRFHLIDIFALLGIGGIWVAAFLWRLKQLPLLPLHDPRFEGVLLHEHGD